MPGVIAVVGAMPGRDVIRPSPVTMVAVVPSLQPVRAAAPAAAAVAQKRLREMIAVIHTISLATPFDAWMVLHRFITDCTDGKPLPQRYAKAAPRRAEESIGFDLRC